MRFLLSLVPIGLLICISYIPLSYLFAYFFNHSKPTFNRRAWRSIADAAMLYAVVALIVWLIPSIWWGNRIQHGFGGGFLAFFVCYRVSRDLNLSIEPLRFFIF